MSDQQQQRDDRSSTCSEFEPVSVGGPQTEEEQMDGQVHQQQPNVDYNEDEEDEQQTGDDNNGDDGEFTLNSAANLGSSESKSMQQQHHVAMAAEENGTNLAALNSGLNLHICGLELKLANAEKEKAELKAEMVEMKAKQDSVELQKKIDRKMEEKVAELGTNLAEEMRAKLQDLLHTIKGEVETRLEQLENGSQMLKLVDEERLKDWLSTGAGLLRNVVILRVATDQQLVTSGHWVIQTGGLRAKKSSSSSIWGNVRALQPFPVATGRPPAEDKLLYYFEVTMTVSGSSSNVHIGLCGADFPFTTDTFVGNEAGSFGICKDGTYWGSDTSQSGFAKGPFVNGDVVGCGLLVLPTERRLFFTKSGEIWGKPIRLGPEDAKVNLYPIVCANETGTDVEFNFGADWAAKPFKYELYQLNVIDA